MIFKRLAEERHKILNFLTAGCIIGFIFSAIEYLARVDSSDPQAYVPLLIRSLLAGLLISGSVAMIEILLEHWFRQRRYLFLLFFRSFSFAAVITFWLSIINGFWEMSIRDISFTGGVIDYLTDQGFLINLLSTSLVLLFFVGLLQISSLHRKGELLKFILGQYHFPKEVERIFCFIDLKSSTTIAEQLGHLKFSLFLKDYYSDITEAIRSTKAEIYQYVGDEVVLSWSYKEGIKNNNAVRCFFMMQDIIEHLKEKYLNAYGVFPEFKAGIHGGRVIVTWIGEIKKEIVYIGDVLNTTARIQEDCKRLSKDFLISKDLLDHLGDLKKVKTSFVEETIPRGKEKKLKLYSLER